MNLVGDRRAVKHTVRRVAVIDERLHPGVSQDVADVSSEAEPALVTVDEDADGAVDVEPLPLVVVAEDDAVVSVEVAVETGDDEPLEVVVDADVLADVDEGDTSVAAVTAAVVA